MGRPVRYVVAEGEVRERVGFGERERPLVRYWGGRGGGGD